MDDAIGTTSLKRVEPPVRLARILRTQTREHRSSSDIVVVCDRSTAILIMEFRDSSS